MTSYVDDWLIMASTREECRSLTNKIRALFHRLHLEINFEKSIVEPSQSISYLGMVLHTAGTNILVRVPKDKLRSIRRAARRLLSKATTGSIPVRSLAQVAGRIMAVTKAISPTRMMLRSVYRDIAAAGSWSSSVYSSSEAKQDLALFPERIANWNGSYLTIPEPDVTISTDALDYGWGMSGENMTARGFWSRPQEMHITQKELAAVHLSLQAISRSNPDLIRGKTVLVKSASVAAVCQINHLGGKSSALTAITRRINSLALDLQMSLLHGEAHPRDGKCSSRCTQSSPRLLQLVPEPEDIPDHRQGAGTLRCGLLRKRAECTPSSLQLEMVGPQDRSRGRLSPGLGP